MQPEEVNMALQVNDQGPFVTGPLGPPYDTRTSVLLHKPLYDVGGTISKWTRIGL